MYNKKNYKFSISNKNLQQFNTDKLELLELLLLVSDGLETGQKGSMITRLKHLIFRLQLVPAGLKPLQVRPVGVGTSSSITSHHLHLR